jgi:hypothetical protein
VLGEWEEEGGCIGVNHWEKRRNRRYAAHSKATQQRIATPEPRHERPQPRSAPPPPLEIPFHGPPTTTCAPMHAQAAQTNSPPSRPLALLPLLARSPRLLRHEHESRRRLGESEMRAHTRGLLRVSAPQERGMSAPNPPIPSPQQPPTLPIPSPILLFDARPLTYHNRQPASRPCRPHTASSKRTSSATTRPRRARYADWGFWTRRSRRRT